jgi:GAF domain-containing protein
MAAGNGTTPGAESSLASLGAHFEELRALLVSAHDGPPDPDRVVRFAAHAVPHADHCALTLVRGERRPTTVAATSDVAPQVDALQYRLGEGPCLTATHTNDVVHADDLRSDGQWPAFAAAAVESTPVRSMMSVRLVLSGDARAAMNFYSHEPHAFDDTDVGIGAIFAPFAAIALQSALHQAEATQLHTALNSSRQIGTAIGILMARELITSEQAFSQLAQASQQLNRKLRDIAEEVTETGALPVKRHRPEPGRPPHPGGAGGPGGPGGPGSGDGARIG